MNPWPDWHACNAWCESDVHAFACTYGGSAPPPNLTGRTRIAGVRCAILDEDLAPEADRNPDHPDWPVYLLRVRLLESSLID